MQLERVPAIISLHKPMVLQLKVYEKRVHGPMAGS